MIELKPEEHNGPVYDTDRDKYFENYDEALDYFYHEDEDECPDYLYVCTEHPCPKICLDSAIQDMCDNMYEDAYDDIKGLDELEKAVEEFNKKQTIVTWHPDMTKRIKFVPLTKEQVESE